MLGLESTMTDLERTLVVLKPAGGDLFALAVDRIHDHEELVVKPAAPAVMATGLYAGTTLADDGSPILLFDPAGLAEVGGIRLEAQERGSRVVDGRAAAAAVAAESPVLLFRGLDGARRAIRLGIVDRIEEVPADAIRPGAGQLRVQLGEAILPLAGAAPDASFDGKVRLFRLNDGTHEIGYAFAEVIDLMAIDHDVIAAHNPGEVSGVTLIGGEPAELVDVHWLFAEHLGAARAPARRWCAACRSTIRGCRTCSARSSRRPAISSSATATNCSPTSSSSPTARRRSASGDARVLTLAADPDAADGKDKIYRYDRAGLMLALKSAGAGRGR